MANLIRVDNLEFSDGPDRLKGGAHCPDQHDGLTREGVDWCCCCDPCRYIRPPQSQEQRYCCRCVPRMVCMTFTPDDDANACCRSVSLPLLAEFATSGPSGEFWTISYTGTIGGLEYTLAISKEADDGPCYWKVYCASQYVEDHVEVDHSTVTCRSVPELIINGVVDDAGCVGTISFANYEAAKLPFHHVVPDSPDVEMIELPYSPDPICNCSEVPRYLCVDGIRHEDGSREQVQFEWDTDLNDRWSYMPCGGDPTVDQEHIYLRGDHDGNCYLEFDFEQTGGDTNDWATPPNSLGVDPHEIRDGMVAIESCGCDIHAYSVTQPPSDPDLSQRFVYINAGDCGCWKYLCGKCRCVPIRVCVFGEIDDQYVTGEALWDGEKWALTAAEDSEYTGTFDVRIGPNVCSDCVLTVEGTFSLPFLPSTVVSCGDFLAGEVESEYDEANPGIFNWLWISSAACPCNVMACGICAQERCGGPPKVVYFDLEARTNFIPLPPGWVYAYCNISIVLNYFQRWYSAGGVTRVQCGYIGFKTVYCPGQGGDPDENFVIRVSISDDGFGQAVWRVDRADLTARNPGGYASFANVFPEAIWPPIGSSPASCDPFHFVKDWDNSTRNCQWGCERLPVEIKLTFTE